MVAFSKHPRTQTLRFTLEARVRVYRAKKVHGNSRAARAAIKQLEPIFGPYVRQNPDRAIIRKIVFSARTEAQARRDVEIEERLRAVEHARYNTRHGGAAAHA